MLEKIGLFIQLVKDSAILRQQLYQIIIAAVALIGAEYNIVFLSEKLEAGLDIGLQFLGIGIAFYTMWTRLFKPTPEMTKTAVAKERELKAEGHMPVSAVKARGFANVWLLVVLSFAGLVLAGCPSTLNPVTRAETLSQKVYASYGVATIFAERGAAIIEEEGVDDDLKRPIAQAIVSLKPVADGIEETTLTIEGIRKQVAAGETSEEELLIALDNLDDYYLQLEPLVGKLVSAVMAAVKCGKLTGEDRRVCLEGVS